MLGVTHLPEFILRICAPSDAFQILKSFICLGVFFLFSFVFVVFVLVVVLHTTGLHGNRQRRKLGPSADNLWVIQW